MAKPAKISSSTIQAKPTAPRPVDAAGRELDQFGLPLIGPARKRALAALGKRDPAQFPDEWAGPGLAVAETVTEAGSDAETSKGN